MTMMIPAWIDGELTPVEKLDAHVRGLRHKAVSVFVMDGNKVLLQKRAAGKYHTPGLWTNTCCTHPDWDETAEACAVRRLGEELGIAGVRPLHRGQVEYRADVGGGLTEHEVVEVFTAEAGRGLAVAPNPEEVEEVRWVALGTLADEIAARPGAFTPWLRIYLSQHRDMIFGERLAG
ncbi:MAG: isopentenyl-diphosphate Delta-isomerase [Paracoccaceae bacterium]|nr:isopentenyl-diphosphate Delta-isomerase [Paracoccaceae bacterium]